MKLRLYHLLAVSASVLSTVSSAQAQPAAAPAIQPTNPQPAATLGEFKPFAVVEAYYAWNFNQPVNGLNNDHAAESGRHNNFTVGNFALGGLWKKDALSGKVVMMFPQTPGTVYPTDPVSSGKPGLADATTWKYVQEAWLAYKAPVLEGLTISAGFFRGPFTMEKTFVKDNWNLSRGLSFFGTRVYYAGVRLRQQFTKEFSFTLSGLNGWNGVIDNNEGKTIDGQLLYEIKDQLAVSLQYMGGPERAKDSPEGDDTWRHTFDVWGKLALSKRVWIGLGLNGGFEDNNFGRSYWYTGSLYSLAQLWRQDDSPAKGFYLATRVEGFHEEVAQSSKGKAAPIFWPDPAHSNLYSFTATADYRPMELVSFRLEGRYDRGDHDLFYSKTSPKDDKGGYKPDRQGQFLMMLGATAWWQ